MDTISEEDKLQQSKTHEKVRRRVLWIKQRDLSITGTQLWPGVVFPWLKDTVWVELSNLERVSLQKRCPSLHCRCCLETTEGLTWLIWFWFCFFIVWIHKITAAIRGQGRNTIRAKAAVTSTRTSANTGHEEQNTGVSSKAWLANGALIHNSPRLETSPKPMSRDK